MIWKSWIVALIIGGGVLSATLTLAGEKSVTPESGRTGEVIFNQDTYLRTYLVEKVPVFATKEGQVQPVKKMMASQDGWTEDQRASSVKHNPNPDINSLPPTADWFKPDFDDSRWTRRQAPFEEEMVQSVDNAFVGARGSLICVRSGFHVDDPNKAKDLKVSIEYVGGAAVYVNGKELIRANLPTGELGPDTLADNYPDDLYVGADGVFIDYNFRSWSKDQSSSCQANFERRYRKISDVVVPPELLRKGPNVLAVELHRAPINEGSIRAKRAGIGSDFSRSGAMGSWAYVALRSLNLTCSPGSEVSSNFSRPSGIQIWNCAPWDTIQSSDYGIVGEPLRPVIVSAAKNGVFSGRLVVSSDNAIRGIKVSTSELLSENGSKLPLSAVKIYCAQAAVPDKTIVPPFRYNSLVETVPSEIAVNSALPEARDSSLISRSINWAHQGEHNSPQAQALPDYFTVTRKMSAGAIAPIWVIVRVPKEAVAGKYEGTISISAVGLAETKVPLHLTIHDWTLPDPKDFRSYTTGYVSVESEAGYYGVPLWSEKHWELVGRTFGLMSEINARQVIVDLTIDYYGAAKDPGNRESIVRWIKDGEGIYRHDFSILDKYLDTVAKNIGKPLPIRFNYAEDIKESGSGGKRGPASCVTLLNPSTGALTSLEQPLPGTEESYKFWKPVLDEIRKKMEARGWFDVTALGYNTHVGVPTPDIVDVAKRIWPDGVWTLTHHGGVLGFIYGKDRKMVSMPVHYAECVWGLKAPRMRGYNNVPSAGFQPLFDPKRPPGFWTAARTGQEDDSELDLFRRAQETRIMQSCDGGQMGANFWPLKMPNGSYGCIANARGGLGPTQNGTECLLAPGPDGAIITERFQVYREGVQTAEAVLFVEKALEAKKVSGELEQRANRLLDERCEAVLGKLDGVNLFERDEELLALAAQVAKSVH
jgi:hypothetical protein